jgi:two-component system, cell cycle sensor histidine kinase and response regulator CckA
MDATARLARVLIVDDEETILRLVQRVLSGAAYDTFATTEPTTALALGSSGRVFDLLVTDLMMPGMQGDELARRLRLHRPDLKVLYLTGFADRLFDVRTTLWENEAFVEKPVTPNGLLEAVSLALFGYLRGPDRGGEPPSVH